MVKIEVSAAMKEEFKRVLGVMGCWPLDNWTKVHLEHGNGIPLTEKRIREEAHRQTGLTLNHFDRGIYVYKNSKGNTLYIGEGKLTSRFLKHYQASNGPIDRDPHGRYHEFFSTNPGMVTIRFLRTKGWGKWNRELVEMLLIGILEPSLLPLKTVQD